ncbi:MAG: alpha/beta fold hydrolase [Cyanobacteria bacterium]|jgi:pimeloyl-ACP methyl ester carboxylesterase|nr:alpha/beta fold hydrolase [Cyanobacteria bacterium GSL.Bin1]
MKNWWQNTFPDGQKMLPVSNSQGEFHHLAYGERGEGPPIIFLHGIGSWSYSWRRLIPILAQQFRVIAFDATGHGFSDKPSRWKITQLQQELPQVIAALCDEPATIIAQSLGGLVTLAAALDYPQHFARLVLINAAIFPEALPSLSMRFLAKIPLGVVREIDQSRLVKPLAPIVREAVRFARREVVATPAMSRYEDVYALTYPFIENPGAIAHFTQTLQQAAREIECLERQEPNLISYVQDNLSQILCPTLILWGDCDRWFPLAHGEALQERLPNSRLEILENCGHDAIACASEQIEQKIIQFLQEQVTPPVTP